MHHVISMLIGVFIVSTISFLAVVQGVLKASTTGFTAVAFGAGVTLIVYAAVQ